MKGLRAIGFTLFIFLNLAAVTSTAAGTVWSTCETVTAVNNYTAYNGGVYLQLSPALPGCSGTAGQAFYPGQEGVTATNINSFLATALAAKLSGHQVTVFYDNTSSNCYLQIVALGGYQGQCS